MNSKIEQFYSDIGSTALALADKIDGKLLLYAEVEDGAISADLFYMTSSDRVRFRFCSAPLRGLIYDFWECWKTVPGNIEWRTLAYIVNDGKFKIKLTHPEDIDPDEDVSDRRPSVVREHFGDAKIDYSNPN